MTARITASARIGDVERAAAQRALQQHLDAGRLQVAEFVERFGGAADAVTAGEIAALFADLPAPHPTLPGPPRRTRRPLVVAGAVALLVLAGLLGFVIGRGRAVPAPAPATVASGAPADSAAESPDLVPGGVTVRRSTGPGLITLHPSDGVDLDDLTDPAWDVGPGCCGDVVFGPDTSRLSVDGGHAPATGPLEFATCLHETAYSSAAIGRGRLQPGETICVRTSGRRLALVTIVAADERAVEFGATVWDPPVPS